MTLKRFLFVSSLVGLLSVATGALSSAAPRSAGPAPAASDCLSGKALGLWNLPERAQRGSARGLLIDDGGGRTFLLQAQLVASPIPGTSGGGVIEGQLFELDPAGTSMRPFAGVSGRYVVGRRGRGMFEAVVLRPASAPGKPPVELGKFSGAFEDGPDRPGAGRFAARWSLCR